MSYAMVITGAALIYWPLGLVAAGTMLFFDLNGKG